MMPFAVQVYHEFVDSIHIGKLADKLQRYLDEMQVNNGRTRSSLIFTFFKVMS
jgi:hypothetical protein